MPCLQALVEDGTIKVFYDSVDADLSDVGKQLDNSPCVLVSMDEQRRVASDGGVSTTWQVTLTITVGVSDTSKGLRRGALSSPLEDTNQSVLTALAAYNIINKTDAVRAREGNLIYWQTTFEHTYTYFNTQTLTTTLRSFLINKKLLPMAEDALNEEQIKEWLEDADVTFTDAGALQITFSNVIDTPFPDISSAEDDQILKTESGALVLADVPTGATGSGYSDDEIDDFLADKADSIDVYTKTASDILLDEKADVADHYTQTQVDDIIADYYTQEQVDELLDALPSGGGSGYDDQEIDDFLALKADVADVYIQADADDLLDEKADSTDVYTKVAADVLLDAKADESEVDTKLDEKQDKVTIPTPVDADQGKIAQVKSDANVLEYKAKSIGFEYVQLTKPVTLTLTAVASVKVGTTINIQASELSDLSGELIARFSVNTGTLGEVNSVVSIDTKAIKEVVDASPVRTTTTYMYVITARLVKLATDIDSANTPTVLRIAIAPAGALTFAVNHIESGEDLSMILENKKFNLIDA